MEFIISLYPLILDWLDLVVRWIHIIVGIAWIGTSFYFNWLDSRLDREIDNENIEGELWSVHSGGFYHINKLKRPPTNFPKELHWFKWEAYTTWISGFVLLIIVYYFNAEGIMIDKNINDINSFTAIIISLIFLLGSWFLYDFLCKSKLIASNTLFILIILLLLTLVSFSFTKIFGAKFAFLSVGLIIGTNMFGNVFTVIIPNQMNIINSSKKNKKFDQSLSLAAKQRSIHNNYSTFIVLFFIGTNNFIPFNFFPFLTIARAIDLFKFGLK